MSYLRVGVAVVVTIVWTAGYGKAILTGAQTPPAELSGIMLAVVTWLFGSEAKRLLGKGNGNGKR